MQPDAKPALNDVCAENMIGIYQQYAQRRASLRSRPLFEKRWLGHPL
ncbi:hypothetical protein ACI2JR_00140 [Klebsiella sp. NPDC088457]|nr:hypothetical protein [Raoultella sp. BIGb0138]